MRCHNMWRIEIHAVQGIFMIVLPVCPVKLIIFIHCGRVMH